MALGAFIVAAAYLVLATVSSKSGPGAASWLWLVLFFIAYTYGELHILPTGLGLFGRLAPSGLAATTLAAWFFATFSGSLAAGLVGALWTRMSHGAYFALLALVAAIAGAMLLALDRPARRIGDVRRLESSTIESPHPGVA
jgi:POT family proton-dependent oligopeptide transporter